ncbi:basic proline-rich protein-like [Delphinus delphis]|uniref:basic proline-rich protein-like n=1 Tax=Delphinus delphis TaxID=9728 RepID=UPI0037529068
MGRAPGPRKRRKGRAGGRRRGRPLSAERDSAPPSATATAALRPPPLPELEASPGGGLGPQDSFRRRGRTGRAGQGGEDSTGGCSSPAARLALPGPPRARPRGRASAGAQLPPDPAGRDAADPARCGPSTLDIGTSAEGLSRKGSETPTLAPISRTRPQRSERGRSRTREGSTTWLRPLPAQGLEETGVMPRATNRLFRPRAGAWRGQAPFSGIGGGKLPARASAPRPPAEPRAALAHSRRPRARPPAARAPVIPGRPPPRPPHPGATSLKAAPSASKLAGRKGTGPGAGRSGIPERAQRPPPGTGRGQRALGADSVGGPHPLPRPRLCTGGGAPRSPRPFLRLLDLARVLKAGPGGTRASGRRVSLPPAVVRERLSPSTSLAASAAAGVAKKWKASGSRRRSGRLLRPQIHRVPPPDVKRDPSLPFALSTPPARPLLPPAARRSLPYLPGSSGPAGEDLIRRVANTQERRASPAAEPGVRADGGVLLPPSPPARSRPSSDVPGSAPAGARRPPPLPPPAGAPRAPGRSGCPGCGRCGARGPGPGQDAARPPVFPARRLHARSAGAAANAAPAAACARRSLSGRRRRSAPVACPAPLAFFPLPGGGGGEPSRAEPGAGRRGEEEEEAEDEEKEEERGELLPPTGLPALPNLSLSETGSRIGSQRLHYGLHQAL